MEWIRSAAGRFAGQANMVPAAMQFELPYRAERGFDALYGLTVEAVSDREARGSVEVSDDLKQPAGLVHGGVYASVAESLASMATAISVMAEGKQAMGLSNQTSFLRPVTAGAIHARAVRKHRGRSTWVWEVEFTDDQDRLCVLTRMTIAVREPRPQAP